MELHCSQTVLGDCKNYVLFETPMELHCSQTSNLKFGIKIPKTTCNCLR